ncbi:MAG: ABC transporter permease [Acidobacteriota bacterium]|nr:ABC transporter permease [Acidobacteriota bacterium]
MSTDAFVPPTSSAASRPSFARAALQIYDLSLSQMLWSRRTVFMALVIGGPVVVAVILRMLVAMDLIAARGVVEGRPVSVSGPIIFGLMIWGFYLRFSVPLLGVFYGTSLIADEVEDKTITYLFTRPLSRGAVLVGKYLAYLVCTGFVVLPSVMLVFFLVVPLLGGSIGASFLDLIKDLALLAVGLAVYGAVFALVGALFKRPLLTGLVFVFGWEPIVVVVPGYMKRFTVSYYLQGLVPHAMPQDGVITAILRVLQANEVMPSVAVSVMGLTTILFGGLVAATWMVERREYVLEQ